MSATSLDASQSGFAYRFDWGIDGLEALAPACDVIVVVDVLRFTTAVSAAVEAGAVVFPFGRTDDHATDHAATLGAQLAGKREGGGASLSPTDLLTLDPGSRILLPSANGSTLAVAATECGVPFVLAGSLRNAGATACRAMLLTDEGGAIGVIAAGERWTSPDGTLRPAVEDLLGAGAVLHGLDPSGASSAPECSPEARAARAAFLDARPRLFDHLLASPSGRELARLGWHDDIAHAAALDATRLAAQLDDGAFVGV